ncbi:MAG TPA: hypothetical protein VF136_17130 [Methylomirabilota bacterium]
MTVKVTLPEVPPPGAGVTTVTGTERAVARSAAVIAARSWVALTNVVVRAAPFQRTLEEATKPLPLTVSVTAALPSAALAGERLLTTGMGDVDELAGPAGTGRTLQAWSVLCCPVALIDRTHTNPSTAAPLAWYGIRSCSGGAVTVPCRAELPSLNAAA